MSELPFVDHYEVLQLSPNATADTIEKVYRILAKRYHPDNLDTGDPGKFNEVKRAFDVLSDPERRIAYDVKYDENRSTTWKVFNQKDAGDSRSNDRQLFHGILSLLYVARRRNPKDGGLGAVTLEQMLACPREHLEFPLWYLRQRGWIERTDSGLLAITVDGIDKLGNDDLLLPANRLIADASEGKTTGDAGTVRGPVLLRGATTRPEQD